MSVKLFAIVLAISSLRCYDCQITCEKALNYLGCTAESENNILQRGTASDDEEIQTISLVNCKITDIQEESFEGLPSLQTLDVSFNSLPTLNLGVLSGLSNVQTFNLSHNFITELPLGVFDQLTSLTALDLSNNKIAELSLGIFDANVYLRSLYLEVNELQGLPLGIFDKSRNIQEIDLSSNDMSSLLLGIFDSLPQLQIVDLTTSKFADMPSGIFDGNKQLTELHLAGNEITAIPDKHFHDLRRLTIVDLSDNKLSQIQGDLFAAQTALRFLNLSTNLLTDISQVTLIRTISTLDVSKNKISVLPTFNMPDLKYLDVSGNRLTNLGQNVGMSIPKKLKILKLYKNPWQCACLDQILTILRRRKINYEYSSYFEGKKPVCVVAKNKVNRCFRDTVQDQQLYTAYNQALKKYKDMSLL